MNKYLIEVGIERETKQYNVVIVSVEGDIELEEAKEMAYSYLDDNRYNVKPCSTGWDEDWPDDFYSLDGDVDEVDGGYYDESCVQLKIKVKRCYERGLPDLPGMEPEEDLPEEEIIVEVIK